MGIIKDLLLKIEELKNKYEILQGKFDKLKINVDLVNTKSKEFPDAFTYKPQQPYLGIGGIGLKLVKEGIVYPRGNNIIYKYITSDRLKWYLLVREIKISSYRSPDWIIEEIVACDSNRQVRGIFSVLYSGIKYEDGQYKFFIGDSVYLDPEDYYYTDVHYKIYEVFDFGDFKII